MGGSIQRPTNAAVPDRTGHIPEIDGLRAVAVVLVVIFHAFPRIAPGGFVGVDIFFVISGFVISRSYLNNLLTKQVTLRDFYTARFRRLAPALFVVLFLTTVAAYLLVLPSTLQLYANSLIAQPLYLQNFVFWNEGDYFQAAYTKPLLHTWSLAVEEQFYVLFGLAILILRPAPKVFLPLLLAGAIMSVAMGILLVTVSPKTSFYMFPTRLWQFALGIFAYAIAARIGVRKTAVLDVIGAVCVGLCIAVAVFLEVTWTFPGPNVYVACLAAAVALICFDIGPGRLVVLRLAPLRYLGKISYGLYLWHWPPMVLFLLYLNRWPDTAEMLALVALAFVGTVLSYHFVEQPIRNRRALPTGAALRRFIFGAMVVTACAGFALVATSGAIFRYPEDMQKFFAATKNTGTSRCPKAFRIANPNSEMCPLTQIDGGSGVLLLGDSHADVLDEMLTDLATQSALPLYLIVRSCDLGLFGETDFCAATVLDTIISEAKANGISNILAISRWPQERMEKAAFDDQLDQLVSAGFDVTIMEAVPYGADFDPIMRVREALAGGQLRYNGQDTEAYYKSLGVQQSLFAGGVERHGNRVAILRPGPFLCPHEECLFHTDGMPNYMDGKHLNATGRVLLLPMFEQYFQSLKPQ